MTKEDLIDIRFYLCEYGFKPSFYDNDKILESKWLEFSKSLFASELIVNEMEVRLFIDWIKEREARTYFDKVYNALYNGKK